MRYYFVFVLFMSFGSLFGQFSDDFSDGNLTNPNWQGDLSSFVVNGSNQLQLNASEAGTSAIVLSETVSDSSVWEMWLKMDFSPSESNRLKIYLLASTADLAGGDAVFLVLGENGNNDAIQVFQRVSGVETMLGSSALGSIASAPVELHVQVEKISENWRLLVDFDGGNNLLPVTNWNSTLAVAGDQFFGLDCRYTATRVDKFYFDNISLSKWLPDTEPPNLVLAQANTAQKVTLSFDEMLNEPSLSVANFTLTGNVTVADVGFVTGDSSKVELFLSQDLTNGDTYTVSTQNIADRLGNIGNGNINFTYLVLEVAAPFDILINEIFPDPSPSVGLPETEFIELFNRSNKVLNLNELNLKVNTTNRDLPDYNFLPNSYLILVDEADTVLWTSFEHVVGINLPGLSNSGATLSLNSGVETIHEISYTNHSYRDKNKDDGGWTLEIINPNNPCLGEANLLVSKNLQGGTPGKENSVSDKNFHNDALIFAQAYPASPTTIELFFDQSVSANGVDITKYDIEPNIMITSATVNDNIVTLVLNNPLEAGIVYEISVLSGLENCVNQAPSKSKKIKIGLAETPQRGDIVINEILFNPVTGGSDYIELLNVSNKIFSIENLTLANLDKANAIRTINSSGLLFPNQYIAFSPNRFQVVTQYDPPDTAWIVENSLPSLDDDKGNVSVIFGGQIIDSVQYTKDMHISFITNESGVALERINPLGHSLEHGNWISGVSNTNYGTPGYRNAQYSVSHTAGNDYVQVEQKVFSPNGDGFEDFVLFYYDLPNAGYSLNAQIFNAEGQLVHRLVNNDLLGRKGQIRWDGVDNSGALLAGGIYVVRFEFFRVDGEKVVELESCGVVWPD